MHLLIVLGLLLGLLTSCATSPPDIPICTELTINRAYCVHTLSNDEFYFDDTHKLNGQTYWEARPTLLLMPWQSWVQLKAWIIAECKATGHCAEISSWDRTIQTIDQLTKGK